MSPRSTIPTEQPGGRAAEHHGAAKDHLTGLDSRERLERDATLLDGQLSVILVDLDHFKAVNDTYGHNHGDHVLRVVGQRLRRSGAQAELLARLKRSGTSSPPSWR